MKLHYKAAIEQTEQVQIDVTWNLLVQKPHGERQKSIGRIITNE
jgi:hypothetical protein